LTYRTYRTMPPQRRVAAFLALLLAAVGVAAAARADAPRREGPVRIADRVSVGGTYVGGLTAAQARAAVRAAFRRPLALTLSGETFLVAPRKVGGRALVAPAVEAALASGPGQAVPLRVVVDPEQLLARTSRLARVHSREAVDARVRLRDTRPVVKKEAPGLSVRARALARAIASALHAGVRGPLAVPFTKVRPDVTRLDLWPVIVIKRSANRLLLYTSPRERTSRGVATGQPSYPTPLGSFTIVSKQLDPWWYPPDSDWARGLAPVPPGPGNPLGTRWMGLSVPGVGIHGTPDAASIGYSASHGCIRMKIPDAEWLFERVSVGTPVFIVP
jgi:lipoprotein-anchoring transpeptidase ErfK/SrfK